MTKTIKKPISFVLALALVLSLVLGTMTACGSGDKESKKVLATALGVDITAGQINELASFLAVMNGVTLGALEEYQQQNVKNSMTIFCVENEVMKSVLTEKEVLTDDVKAEEDKQLEELYSYSEDMKKNLKDAGVTEETIRYYLESQYWSQAFYDKANEEKPVTDDEIKAYYEEHKTDAKYTSPSTIEVSHILVSDSAISAEGRKKAEEIRAKIIDGEDFAALAEEFSDDTGSAVSGGSIGLVTQTLDEQNRQFVEPFETAALGLKKKGDISEIVETQFGYHILKADTDLSPGGPQTLEAATEQIKSEIASQTFTDALKKLKGESKITYNIDVDAETGEPPVDTQAPTASDADESGATE
jgi:parvulin-like peptidyl-prolyl isomerase